MLRAVTARLLAQGKKGNNKRGLGLPVKRKLDLLAILDCYEMVLITIRYLTGIADNCREKHPAKIDNPKHHILTKKAAQTPGNHRKRTSTQSRKGT